MFFFLVLSRLGPLQIGMRARRDRASAFLERQLAPNRSRVIAGVLNVARNKRTQLLGSPPPLAPAKEPACPVT